MAFIIGQSISILALVISVAIVQFKDVKYILIGEIASNLTVALSFVFLGGMSGAWNCIVAAVQSYVMYLANKKNMDEKKRKLVILLFALIYIVGSIMNYAGWNDCISLACAMLYVLAVMQKESKYYRGFMVLNSALWLIYDFNVMAYVNIITHGLVLISLLVAVVRLDIKRVKEN